MSFVKLVAVCQALVWLLCVAPIYAAPIVVLNEEFNDVTRADGTAFNVGGSRLVDNAVSGILQLHPAQLPAGTSVSPGQTNGINVREQGNAINVATGTTGFDDFFSTPFLVLGDNSGQLGSTPSTGDFVIRFPFTVPLGASTVTVEFSYAFDGVDTSADNEDFFSSSIVGATTLELLAVSSPSFLSQPFSILINPVDLPLGPLSLEFKLHEAGSNTNTAAGIDDIRIAVATVPEPSPLFMLGAGLLSMCWVRRCMRHT